jgi:hypothetical protein
MSEIEESFADKNPRPQMPPFINRHEPNVPGLLRRGHLHPSEWDVRFDKNNQPVRPTDDTTPSSK